MFNPLFRILAVILIGLFVGVIGLFIGMLIGGNYAEQFMFNGVQGYEATGQVGFILGSAAGWLAGWLLLMRKHRGKPEL